MQNDMLMQCPEFLMFLVSRTGYSKCFTKLWLFLTLTLHSNSEKVEDNVFEFRKMEGISIQKCIVGDFWKCSSVYPG